MKTYKTLKRYIVHYGWVLLLWITTSLQAQATTEAQLVGTWLFEDTASFASIEPATQAHMDTIPQIRSQLVSSYRGRKVTFGSDGMYSVSLSDGRTATGSWQLTSSTEIKLTDPRGNVSYQQIASLQGNRLILIPMASGSLKSIIKQQHFVKL